MSKKIATNLQRLQVQQIFNALLRSERSESVSGTYCIHGLEVKRRNQPSPFIGCFDPNSNIELKTFVKSIKKEVIGVINFFP
jgi:hypothetical protein